MDRIERLMNVTAIGIGSVAIARGIIAGGFGITEASFVSMFVATLCALYAQICSLARNEISYKFFTRTFTIASVLSCLFLQGFLPRRTEQYILIHRMDPDVQRWIVGFILLLLGSLTVYLALLSVKGSLRKS